jgi:predicted peptidase
METGFLRRTVTVANVERKHAIYIPDAKMPAEGWPAILMLHGRGESGTDGMKQLWHGAARAIIWNHTEWPFIVLCPQKPEADDEWFDHKPMLDAILAQTERAIQIDPHRRYLTGLSQGGRGTMRLAKKLAWQFAAIAPVCGWVDQPAEIAKEIQDLPAWFFHGEADTVVPPSGSKSVVAELEKLGAKPKLTLYPNVGHNSWEQAYRDEGLAAWFLEHRL